MEWSAANDWCTLWMEGSWAYCCYIHDYEFSNPNISFFEANWNLTKCVAQENPVMAILMGLGTTLGGVFFRRTYKSQYKAE